MRKLTKWLTLSTNLFLMLICAIELPAQSVISKLNLEQAYQLARSNYPLIKQKDLISKTAFLTIENINTAYLPQLSVNGQASYQSDVTSINIPIAGASIVPMSKDQYKIWGELNQLIYDGGIIKNQKQFQERSNLIDDQKLEVELYKLKDRINQLYLGLLLIEAQISQAKLLNQNIQIGLKTVNAQLASGTVFKSAALVLEAQLLQTDQRIVELKSNKLALSKVLGLFINQQITEATLLEKPEMNDLLDATIDRPEIKLYAYQDSLLYIQNQLVSAKSIPKISLFAQGGYGRPGLNMLNNDFALFGIGGVRLNWSLSNLYTRKREHQVVALNQKINEVQKDVFVFNTTAQLSQQLEEVKKLQALSNIDQKIIDVRTNITAASKAQLQNGVINSNDYLREVNAEDQTRNNYLLHQIQLLQAKINYKTIKGNQ
ncbi:MAG TPA: TolC family protein [Sediminibacterium sp.]|nr:TolC family protein [Sediminibacterium sp.]